MRRKPTEVMCHGSVAMSQMSQARDGWEQGQTEAGKHESGEAGKQEGKPAGKQARCVTDAEDHAAKQPDTCHWRLKFCTRHDNVQYRRSARWARLWHKHCRRGDWVWLHPALLHASKRPERGKKLNAFDSARARRESEGLVCRVTGTESESTDETKIGTKHQPTHRAVALLIVDAQTDLSDLWDERRIRGGKKDHFVSHWLVLYFCLVSLCLARR